MILQMKDTPQESQLTTGGIVKPTPFIICATCGVELKPPHRIRSDGTHDEAFGGCGELVRSEDDKCPMNEYLSLCMDFGTGSNFGCRIDFENRTATVWPLKYEGKTLVAQFNLPDNLREDFTIG